MNNGYFRDFGDFIAERFHGQKMQKLAINAGFSCPNRDGTIGRGGCTYCLNSSFNPGYCSVEKSVSRQIEEGRRFFGRKYPSMRYLAYFQAYTNTHGELSRLLSLYNEALECDCVDGLIIGTRPDCMPEGLLAALTELNKRKFVMIEYGAESSNNLTLERINRCHSWETTVDAVSRTADAGLPVGIHLIMGLPGETREDMLRTVDEVNRLPIDVVKIHQLQLIKGTRMAMDVERGLYDIPKFTADEYLDLCVEIVHRLRKDIAIERFVSQSPPELLIYPRWGLKNYQFTDRLLSRLAKRR